MTDGIHIHNGAAFRLLTLMTHYRQPLDFSKRRMDEAQRVLERWARAAIRNDAPPPMEILTALTEDLNTPKAIAAMHVYRRTDGEKLYAAMRFLGLADEPTSLPDDWRTIPGEHAPPSGPACTNAAA